MFRKALFTLSLIGLSFSCAQATASESIPHDALIDAIVANADDCVTGYADEKIYLNAERIFPTEEGLLLNLNGQEHVVLPLLYSDQEGCYIAVYAPVKTRCPGCGKEFTFFHCRTQGCPYNPKTPK